MAQQNWWEAAPVVQQTQQQAPSSSTPNWWDSAPLAEESPLQMPSNPPPPSPGMQKALEEADRRVQEASIYNPMAWLRAAPEALGGTLLNAAQGATFNFADEGLAGLKALARSQLEGKSLGQAYDESLNEIRGFEQGFNEQNPGASALAQFSGGLGTVGVNILGSAVKGAQAVKNSSGFLNGLFNLSKNVAKGSALGGAYAGLAGFGSGEGGSDQRLENAIDYAETGAKVGGAFPVGGTILRGAGKAIVPAVDEAIQSTAQLAQKYNIPLGLDQIAGSKTRQFLTSTTGRIPFSGGSKLAETQQKAFNREVLKTIGADGAEKVSEEVVDSAVKNIGQKFDDVLGGKTITLSPEHIQKFKGIADEASMALAADKQKSVQAAINKVLDNVDEAGQISGEKINDVRSSLSKIAKNADPGIKQYINDIVDQVVDISTEGNPAARELLNTARYQWKNLRTLEPLLAKSFDGNIKPALLKNAVINKFGGLNLARGNAGELGDLAKVGDLLKSKIGDTGTAERLASYSALSGGGLAALSAFNPALALKVAGGIGTSAAYQAYNRAQPLVNAAIRGGKASNQNLMMLPQINQPALIGRSAVPLLESGKQ
jgi:hypothetical protein